MAYACALSNYCVKFRDGLKTSLSRKKANVSNLEAFINIGAYTEQHLYRLILIIIEKQI